MVLDLAYRYTVNYSVFTKFKRNDYNEYVLIYTNLVKYVF